MFDAILNVKFYVTKKKNEKFLSNHKCQNILYFMK